MSRKRPARWPYLLLVSLASLSAPAQAPDAGLVDRALARELASARDLQHPMRYRLRKTSPRLSSVKEIFETRDGSVARLLEINDRPLSPGDEQKEQERLRGLVSDPSRQKHRKQAEEQDTARVIKVLSVLPRAFLYKYAGTVTGASGRVERFSFVPNPGFNPPDMDTHVLTAMTGEIWVDPAEERVTRLEGHLAHDVDFGWGILGRLYKDGWVRIEQEEIGDHQWRIIRFQMQMSARVIVRTKNFDTLEEQSRFAPVPPGIGYREAVRELEQTDQRSGRPDR